jgi:N-acetylmuramoyl-L-alanine amidase
MITVALINAHTKYAKGASCEFAGKVYAEYPLSVDINKKISSLLDLQNIKNQVIDASHISPYNTSLRFKAETVNTLSPQLAIETHFNAGPNKALSQYSSGMEVIFTDKNGKVSELLANCCMSSMSRSLPFKIRRSGTGLYNTNKLYILNNILCPVVIIEICFLTHPVDRLFLLHQRSIEAISNTLTTGIMDFINMGEYNDRG